MAFLTAKSERLEVYRPVIGSGTLSALGALFLLFFLNRTFWGKIHTYLSPYPVAITALYVAMSALLFN